MDSTEGSSPKPGPATSGTSQAIHSRTEQHLFGLLLRQERSSQTENQLVSLPHTNDTDDSTVITTVSTTIRRRLLAAPDTTQQVQEETGLLSTVEAGSDLSKVPLGNNADPTLTAQPVHNEAPIEDAAHQQAMQHGLGGLESATVPGRELRRQLGQRFNAPQVVTGSDHPQAPDLPIAQAEITPGNGPS